MTLLFLMTFADSRLFTLDRLSTFYSRSTLDFLLSIDSRLFTLDRLSTFYSRLFTLDSRLFTLDSRLFTLDSRLSLSTLDFYSRLSTFTLDSRPILSTLDPRLLDTLSTVVSIFPRVSCVHVGDGAVLPRTCPRTQLTCVEKPHHSRKFGACSSASN